MGLASPSDLETRSPAPARPTGLWAKLRSLFNTQGQDSVQAVCIPPGARLAVEDIPASLQRSLGIGPVELVTFKQLAAPSSSFGQFGTTESHRDALRFRNGREVRLQDLPEGQRVWVMCLSGEEASDPVRTMVRIA